jgi:c-di-GMP-binding flagellar brake protein YcgR
MSETSPGILSDAIARNAAAVLSLPSAGMLRHHKTRFLAETPDGFWVESAAGDRALVDAVIAGAHPAGISFRGGIHRVAFTAPLLRRDAHFRVNSVTTVEAILVAFPKDIKAIQRRHYYRVRITPESELSVRVWRISEPAQLRDRPLASLEIAAEARNLSAGGVGLTLKPKADELRHMGAGDRLRIMILHAGDELLLEGRVRHRPTRTDGPFNVGVQFARLESNLEGRQILAKLTNIIGRMQRDEVRRTRLGLAG